MFGFSPMNYMQRMQSAPRQQTNWWQGLNTYSPQYMQAGTTSPPKNGWFNNQFVMPQFNLPQFDKKAAGFPNPTGYGGPMGFGQQPMGMGASGVGQPSQGGVSGGLPPAGQGGLNGSLFGSMAPSVAPNASATGSAAPQSAGPKFSPNYSLAVQMPQTNRNVPARVQYMTPEQIKSQAIAGGFGNDIAGGIKAIFGDGSGSAYQLLQQNGWLNDPFFS